MTLYEELLEECGRKYVRPPGNGVNWTLNTGDDGSGAQVYLHHYATGYRLANFYQNGRVLLNRKALMEHSWSSLELLVVSNYLPYGMYLETVSDDVWPNPIHLITPFDGGSALVQTEVSWLGPTEDIRLLVFNELTTYKRQPHGRI